MARSLLLGAMMQTGKRAAKKGSAHAVPEIGQDGASGKRDRLRRRVDGQAAGGGGRVRPRLRRDRHQPHGRLDGRSRHAQRARPCHGGARHARPVDHPGAHRLHLAGRPVRAHARHGKGAPGVRGLAGTSGNRPRGVGHDPLRGRRGRVPRHHGRSVHRIRAASACGRNHRARGAFHPQSRRGGACGVVRRGGNDHVQREPRFRHAACQQRHRGAVRRLRQRLRRHESRACGSSTRCASARTWASR